ncbi:MAG: hypothetical protein JST92_23355 [Deltaproteobacteria bacterium]|nr:hypothetical protein [Deltaproteobacteria bacterium]
MTTTAWGSSSTPSRSLWPLLLLGLVGLASIPRDAGACGGMDPDITQETTFDPRIIDSTTMDSLFYDETRRFGDACVECERKEQLADWATFLPKAVTQEAWVKVLYAGDDLPLDDLIFALKGKKKAPAGFDGITGVKLSGDEKDKLSAALFYLGFLRKVTPRAQGFMDLPAGAPQAEATRVLQGGEGAFARAKEPFLKQRYGFQLLRLRFYAKDFAGLVAFADANTAALAGPSKPLRFRGLHYVAGSLLRLGNRPRANLELARAHAGLPSLGGLTAADFSPRNDDEWKQSLALATDAKDKAALWSLIGLRYDAVTAMREIFAADPKSDLLALLAVRQLAASEATHKLDEKLEALAQTISTTPGADRPWLFALVAAHVSALRGDLPVTRTRLALAQKLHPGDAAMNAQLSETLTIALAAHALKEPGLREEFLQNVQSSDHKTRRDAVLMAARRGLAQQADAAGKELLLPGTAHKWTPEFAKSVLERFRAASTPLDKWMNAAGGYQEYQLLADWGKSLLGAHRYAEAATVLAGQLPGHEWGALGTDPSALRIRDCHDCDHEKFALDNYWTLLTVAQRLQKAEQDAKGTGEPAAKAAFELGAILYNLSWYGNARATLEDPFADVHDTRPAEAAFARAYELTGDREFKAKAAFQAAKCELGRLLEDARQGSDKLPVPVAWFTKLSTLADTRYHQQVIAECGNYKSWRK